MDTLDPESDSYARDLVSVIEAILEDPRQVLWAQEFKARGEAVAAMKLDGIEYEERMERLEEVTWPKPLADLLEVTLAAYRQTHPWISQDALSPKSVVREMYERGMTFNEFVSYYGLSRSEGLRPALPHRRLPHAAPHRPREPPHRGARGRHRVARRARAPDRLEPARRVGGPRQPVATPWPSRPTSPRRPGRSPPTSGPSP